MTTVLLTENSTTRRRAMSSVLSSAGFSVQTIAGFEDLFEFLERMPRSSSEISAIAVGWPDYGEAKADEIFDLLSRDRFEHLPVLVLADSNSPGAVNWMMKRPRSALLNWGDYNEAGEALNKLLRPSPSSPAPGELVEHRGMRVLLVDDSATVRLAFQKLLSKEGYLVEVAASVAEGRGKLDAQSFDIVVTDYFMPNENGLPGFIAICQFSSRPSARKRRISKASDEAASTSSLKRIQTSMYFPDVVRNVNYIGFRLPTPKQKAEFPQISLYVNEMQQPHPTKIVENC